MICGTVVTDTTGLTAIHDALKQRTITLKAVKAGAKIVLNATKSAMKKRDTGLLKKSQGTKASKSKTGLTLSYAVIGARKKFDKMVVRRGRTKPTRAVPAFYDHLVRLGTKPRTSSRAPRKLDLSKLVGKVRSANGRFIRAADLEAHFKSASGTKPDDFRARGWASSKDAAGAATLALMLAEVDKAMTEQERSIRSKLSGWG